MQRRSENRVSVAGALRRCYPIFLIVGAFTALINILALAGSFYMLQIYDRVIPSRSLPTLVGLSVLLVGLYIAYGALDFLRMRIMGRLSLRIDRHLRAQVIACVQTMPLRSKPLTDGLQPIRDLDALRAFMAGAGPTALFDLPWMPVYLALVFLLHPWLGLLATSGAVVLIALTIASEIRTRRPTARAARSGAERQAFSEALRRNAEATRAMGFAGDVRNLWLAKNASFLNDHVASVDANAGLATTSRVVRFLLQSGVLGVGAWLTIRGEATAGVMIAGSIITSRALAPVEIAIGNWRGFVAARQARIRLEKLLASDPVNPLDMQLPRPGRALSVQGLWVAAPGTTTPILQNVSFSLEAGSGLGIVGPSASGKSTLARALVGVWQPIPNRGLIRLDEAAIDQWAPEVLGRDIGYMPQDLLLFDGTVMQNIARFSPEATSEAVIDAARAAGAHDMIKHLPNGYDTRIGEGGSVLSAGQRQRVALARALYGEPFLIVLDEPNSNLDAAGDTALTHAIQAVRARGGIAIVVAHRPSALAGLDQLLILQAGQVRAFGSKEDVIRKTAQEAAAQSGRTSGFKVINEGG